MFFVLLARTPICTLELQEQRLAWGTPLLETEPEHLGQPAPRLQPYFSEFYLPRMKFLPDRLRTTWGPAESEGEANRPCNWSALVNHN